MLYGNMSPYCQMNTEALERFSLGLEPLEETEKFEEHLLICERCQERYEEIERYAIGVRSAAAELQRKPAPRQSWWHLPRMIPVFAVLTLLVMGALFLTRMGGQPVAPLAVALIASRGTAPMGEAPAGRSLLVTPDIVGIATPGPYRLEVVDGRGHSTWQGPYDASQPAAVPPQGSGPHFVRLYSTSGHLLREYGLHITR